MGSEPLTLIELSRMLRTKVLLQRFLALIQSSKGSTGSSRNRKLDVLVRKIR